MIDDAIFAVLDPEFFVSLERRTPGPEFRSLIEGLLGSPEWTLVAHGTWTYVQPRNWEHLQQGWKLHISAKPANARTVLLRVASVLKQHPAAFKFASDPQILQIILSKNWPREGGGKFITVYPSGIEHFKRLAHALTEATDGLDGAYILSDRRVPGSRIVFYRYGEHLSRHVVHPGGTRIPQIAGPAGETVADQRTGYYRLPEWVEDPYGAGPVPTLDAEVKKVTLNERYEVRDVIQYSNLGGVYRGWDLERDRPVVIRERRPGTGWIDDATDAVALLEKEARILRIMDGTRWTPEYVDVFQVWEHHYLVMEQVSGIPLRDYAISRFFRPRRMGSPRRIFWTFRHLILELLQGIQAFHSRGIVIRDLAVGNVLVRPDRSLCFIDFEFAWERGGEQPYAARINTPGFASPDQLAGRPPTEADDFFALGAIVVEMCSMLAPGLALNAGGMLAVAEMAMDEIGLPRELLGLARRLLEPDPGTRLDAAAARQALCEIRASTVPWVPREPGKVSPQPTSLPEQFRAEVAGASEAVCQFFESAADPDHTDCLWPGSVETYRFNPVCIRFGACGPIEYVRRVRGACPESWLDWVEKRAVPERCPPGLYVGLSGVALTLGVCGREDTARRLVLDAVKVPLLPAHASLFTGAAGVGLAALELGTALGVPELQDEAVRIARELELAAKRHARGLAWRAEDGSLPSGLGAGGAGVALFFTYLGACTGEERYWKIAKEALDFEFAQVSWQGGYAFWPMAKVGRRKSYRSPHVRFGAAGIGTVALRLFACTRDPELREWAEQCAHTLTLRWTNKLWQEMGFAGWGETFLDMHTVLGNATNLGHATRIVEVLLAAKVETRFGTAFPGGGLNRVTSDFGMGTSGIALFLHRWLNPASHRVFFPDHLLPAWPGATPASFASRASPGPPPGG